ncbi:hypothetical protein DLD77_05460 [Chitinophaga alhagiae]|uniref:Gfo/Idh/MocA family oxidoreductase n=1 Tax=Chitinophaga alhagiae TaxID=2203219 RepID=A0ABM6WBE2_9BACT|nr:Gfo/Idh/MocA family oxidoreductase [Chitinophaga alhagiae]AWO01176.1 hypothetical protein DLD77_05460 [Chitinophaga alhagiae]
MKKHKIGIIGFGGAGIALFQHFERFSDCSVTSVLDIKETAFERARFYLPSIFTTYSLTEFLNSGIDIVVVTSPDNTHADYIADSLSAGKHVLCEKPLTDSIEGIRKILDAIARHPGQVVGVQHQMRCLPVHTEIHNIVRQGQLGKIGYIEGYYVHNLTKRAFEYDEWRLRDNATPLIYSGIHFVDLLRWIMKDEVVEVCGMANNICFPEYPESDLNVILLKFRSGVIGKVVTAFGAGRPQDHTVQIYGDQRSIFNNMLFEKDGGFKIFARPKKNTLPGRKQAFIKDLAITGFSNMFEKLMKIYPYNAQYNIGFYPIRLYEHYLAVNQSAKNFLDAVNGEAKLQCTALDAARSVAVALAGVEAYRTGATVQVKKYWPKELGQL